MKRVNFNKIKIKNFLSFGDEPVELEFKKGLHIITGINKDKYDRQNGIGKSALMESLYFAIFGTTLRELKKDLIPNTYTNGVCQVELDFDVIISNNKDSYKLIRTLNPSKLFLYKNGIDLTRDSIKNTEEVLHKTINASTSIFENCVIMTLNNTIPFMAKSKIDKRKFIEGIFNLDVFSRMLSDVREDFNAVKRIHEIELTKLEECTRNLNSLESQREIIISNRNEKIELYESRKASNLKERIILVNELEELSKPKDSKSKILEDMQKCSNALNILDKKIASLNEKKFKTQTLVKLNETTLKKLNSNSGECPTCKRAFIEHDTDKKKEESENIKNQIDSDKKILEEVNEQLKELTDKNKKLDKLQSVLREKMNEDSINSFRINSSNKRIEQLDEWLSTLDDDIEKLKKDTSTDLDSLINENKNSFNTIKDSIQEVKTKIDMFDTVKFIVSEEGVKSYIVQKILELFNNKLEFYLNKMDANCICHFDEYFEEQILNDNKKLCSYFNFSGAERKNIDFACLFTFMDMRRLQGDVTYNVTIYDELFDSCLDERGIDLVTNIISERVDKYDECILVISHRKENIAKAKGDVIFLEKSNNITRRIKDNPF